MLFHYKVELHFDTVDSVKKLKKLAKEKNALIVTGHDPHAWEDFKKAPMFYYD